MYDIKKKLNYLRSMQQGSIPEEYRHDGKEKKYKSIYEKYQAIYKLLSECEEEERDCLEVSLKSECETYTKLKSFSEIIPIFLSSAALLFSSTAVCYDALFANQPKEVIFGALKVIIGCVLFTVIIAIVLYALMYSVSETNRRKNQYILEILKKVKEKKQEKNATELEIEKKEIKKTYSITITEKQE